MGRDPARPSGGESSVEKVPVTLFRTWPKRDRKSAMSGVPPMPIQYPQQTPVRIIIADATAKRYAL
eukprot:6036098-Prymnesium_polylepis.1